MSSTRSESRKAEMERQAKRDGAKRARTARQKRRTRRTRGLLAEARASAFYEGCDLPDVRPEDALNEGLSRAIAVARLASERVEELKPEQLWIKRDLDEDTGTYKMIPHVWKAEEDRAWERVCWLASRMIQLDLEARDVATRELASEAFAAVVARVLDTLSLTPKQQKVVRAELPKAIRSVTATEELREAA